MEDPSSERTINKMIHSVITGIDWSSQQVKSACPPRERWSWKGMWDQINKVEKKIDEPKIQIEDEEVYHYPQLKTETNIEETDESNELSRCGYQYCEIKMQDPCAPCCCAIECIETTCSDVAPIDRTPICQCPSRKKIKTGHKCCDACGASGTA